MVSASMQNETFLSMLEILGVQELNGSGFDLLAQTDARYLRDLKINVQNALTPVNLTKKEAALLALSVAVNERCNPLVVAFQNIAVREGAQETELSDAYAVASLLSVNNIFYRFKHFVGKEEYQQMPAGIKMTAMGNPAVGKEFFELLSLAISAVNGCESCVKSHEMSVMQHGASTSRVFDAIRCAGIIKGLTVLVQ